MINPIQIRYNNAPVEIDRLDQNTFCVRLAGRDIRLQYQPDNEGADHWIDLDTNHETNETMEIGEQLKPLMEK